MSIEMVMKIIEPSMRFRETEYLFTTVYICSLLNQPFELSSILFILCGMV